MQKYGTTGQGKSQSGTAGISGTRLVHSVKTLEYIILNILRDTNAGVLYRDIEKLVIGIERYADPAIVIVVFDGIFNKVI